eukprot:COSAG06_NODE_333_length_17341_cov_7.601032_1_plen_115_part_00
MLFDPIGTIAVIGAGYCSAFAGASGGEGAAESYCLFPHQQAHGTTAGAYVSLVASQVHIRLPLPFVAAAARRRINRSCRRGKAEEQPRHADARHIIPLENIPHQPSPGQCATVG